MLRGHKRGRRFVAASTSGTSRHPSSRCGQTAPRSGAFPISAGCGGQCVTWKFRSGPAIPRGTARKLVMSVSENQSIGEKIGELPCAFTKGAPGRQENLPTPPGQWKCRMHESFRRRGNAIAACTGASPAVFALLHAALGLPPPGSRCCSLHEPFPRRFRAAARCICPPTAGNAPLHAARALPPPFPGRCTLHRRFPRRFWCMAADTQGSSPENHPLDAFPPIW